MPLRNPKKYLYDIINCSEFVLQLTKGKTVDDYKNDRVFRSALERELQIIGEAMLQLDHLSPETVERISEHRSIIGFRHVLVHGYDSLDPDTVWNVVETKIALLLEQAKELLL
ncbi:MAG TPA: HepT-like ribonuclease domain-containing protein [Sedimentisphaerales bacterium]|jgi:uncharacterized protein with HEPN domain|nr:HepT-like ribonuclease domain-containing protein [Sedimentisphaerales bacterium]